MRNSTLTTLMVLAVAGAATAQLQKGATAPEFSFDAALNGAPTSFGELSGKLVLVDFFATW